MGGFAPNGVGWLHRGRCGRRKDLALGRAYIRTRSCLLHKAPRAAGAALRWPDGGARNARTEGEGNEEGKVKMSGGETSK